MKNVLFLHTYSMLTVGPRIELTMIVKEEEGEPKKVRCRFNLIGKKEEEEGASKGEKRL